MTPAPICFDATGTLIETAEPVGEVYRRIAVAHGVDLPAWRLDDAFRRILRSAPGRSVEAASVGARRDAERAWWRERIRQTFQAADSTVRFADFDAFATTLFDAYRSATAWRTRTGVVALLDTLRDRRHRLGVISNFDHRLPEILEGLDLSTYFDEIFIPSECGAAKPSRSVFAAAGRRFDCAIEDLVYVGDDAPEVLEAIERHGVGVVAIDAATDLASLPDSIERTATLPRRVERGRAEAAPERENERGDPSR